MNFNNSGDYQVCAEEDESKNLAAVESRKSGLSGATLVDRSKADCILPIRKSVKQLERFSPVIDAKSITVEWGFQFDLPSHGESTPLCGVFKSKGVFECS